MTTNTDFKIGHDVYIKLALQFLSGFGEDQALVDRVCMLVRYHMQLLFVIKDMPFADIKELKKNAGVAEVVLLGLCDRLGRLHADLAAEEQMYAALYKNAGGDMPPD